MKKKVFQIRVVVSGFEGFGRNLLRGICQYTTLCHTNWRLHVELHAYSKRGEEWDRDDGVICAIPDIALVEMFKSRKRPMVNCLAHFKELGIPTVCADNLSIGRLAAVHFLERGFEHFTFYSGGDTSSAARHRFEGYRDHLATMGMAAAYIQQDPAAVLAKTAKPVALFCSHDSLGRPVTTVLTALGLKIPDEVSVLSVDNDLLQCEISCPELSSIEVPYERLGYEAAWQLDRLLHHRKPPSAPLLIQPLGVVERTSTDSLAVRDAELSKAIDYIRKNGFGICTVEDVARHAGMSRRTLEDHFKKKLHQTPHHAIMQVRMKHAQQMLRTTHETLATIADVCGYESPQNFGHAFRKFLGETPAAYRKRFSALDHKKHIPSN